MESKRRPFSNLGGAGPSSRNARPTKKISNITASASSPPISPIYSASENRFEPNQRKKQQPDGHLQYEQGSETGRAFGRLLQTASGLPSSSIDKQKQGAPFITMRPNPHDRLWNPSPSKKARSSSSSSSTGPCRVVLGERKLTHYYHGDEESQMGGGGSWSGFGENSKKGQTTIGIKNNDNYLKGSSGANRHKEENDSRSKFFPNITSAVIKPPIVVQQPAYQHRATDYIIPAIHPQQTSSSDLNNSFTEKISNLDIGSLIGDPVSSAFASEFQQQKRKQDSFHTHHPSHLQKQLVELEGSNKENNNKQAKNKKYNRIALAEKSLPSSSNCSDFWHEELDPNSPYITEILNYWHDLEVKHRISPNYMGRQKEVSFKMRTILVDWLVEVVEEYSLCNATLHRCVQFVDRFLSKCQLSRSNLQLLGTACLFVACKVEEIQPPETGDLVYITDNTYEKSQLVQMECLVLSVLDFDLLTPTAYEFTEYFASILYLTATAKEFSFYTVELTLLHGERFLQFSPSIVALAAVYVAMWCCGDSRHVCPVNEEEVPLQPTTSNNKSRSRSARRSNDHTDMSIMSVLLRIKRLNPDQEFVQKVEEVVSQIFVSILNVSSFNSSSSSCSNASSSETNSVCTKYKQFQDEKYFRAATSAAACFSF